ncbi:unnamed protein product [Cladocopium goreaui]|uniref:UPF0187 protein n=1 Tax=Cladocopium goreaui TaxID=2562237 RepID=A0A9P1DWR4_9DINO|nr:unnamed protein product [Cladocopium goreaui]
MSIDYCREQGSNAVMRWLRGTPIDVNYDFRRWRKHQVATRHLLLWTPRNAMRWDLLRRLLFPDLAWLGLNSGLLCVYNARELGGGYYRVVSVGKLRRLVNVWVYRGYPVQLLCRCEWEIIKDNFSSHV